MPLARQTKILIYVGFVIAFVSVSVYVYQALFTPNVPPASRKSGGMLYIPTGAGFDTVLARVRRDSLLDDIVSFAALARATGYKEHVLPGAYKIDSGMGNLQIIRMLRNGNQAPVRLTFNNMRLKNDLARRLSQKLEVDSATLLARLNDADTCKAYGFTLETITAMFIPNTYEVYWTVKPVELWKKMRREYDKFWTAERASKAAALGLSPVQVATLASIVEAETKKVDEMPIVAGVYLNRLDTGMKLQADPTVVFAVQDFTIKRIRVGHTATISPYNTYMYEGLPPGPINLPSTAALDATLNPARHKYYYFVARADFSGYHTFATDYAQHLKNARIYQAALDARAL